MSVHTEATQDASREDQGADPAFDDLGDRVSRRNHRALESKHRRLVTRPGPKRTGNQSKLLILGAGGIAVVAAEIARAQGFEVVGFLDDKADKHGTEFAGATVLGGFDLLPTLRDSVSQAIVGFSNGHGRLEVARQVLSFGFALPNLIHPSAIISKHASIDQGAIVMPGTIVNAGVHIGSNLILNTAASIDHECTLDCGVHIGPGARMSGLVTVGRASWIGIGALIRESVHIGNNVLIGAGSLVLRDIPDDVVAYGSPAKVIRSNLRPLTS